MKKVVRRRRKESESPSRSTIATSSPAAVHPMAKEAGCKFTFGTNNGGPDDLRRCDYGLEMVEECKLSWQDFFVPGEPGTRAIDRKPNALQG